MLVPQFILEPFGVIGIPSIDISASERDDAMLRELYNQCRIITKFINRHRHDEELERLVNRLDTMLHNTLIRHGVENPHSHIQRIVISRKNRWVGMSYAFTYTLRSGKTLNIITDIPFSD